MGNEEVEMHGFKGVRSTLSMDKERQRLTQELLDKRIQQMDNKSTVTVAAFQSSI